MSDLPIPDPTTLTTEALMREVAHIRELYDTRFEELNLRLQQRFDAQSKALDEALKTSQARSDVLSTKIENQAKIQSESAGKSTGLSASWGVFLGAATLLIAIITAVTFIIFNLNHK